MSVNWGGRTFYTKAALASWLAARGSSYDQWARTHPTAAASLGGAAGNSDVVGGLSPARMIQLALGAQDGRRGGGLPNGPGLGAGPAGPGQGGVDQSYEDMLRNEPIYTSDLANLSASDAADKANLRQNLSSLLVQYGGLPAGFSDPNLDPGVAALAEKNPYSTLARLGRERDLQQANLTADRAARGVLSSGGTTLGQKQIGLDYGQNQYDALNALMGNINSAEGSYAQAVRDRLGQQRGYLSDAQQRLIDAGYAPSGAGANTGGALPPGAGGAVRPGASLGGFMNAYRAGVPEQRSGGEQFNPGPAGAIPGTLADLGASFQRRPWSPSDVLNLAPGSENNLYSTSVVQRLGADAGGRLRGQPGYGASGTSLLQRQLAAERNRLTRGRGGVSSLGTVPGSVAARRSQFPTLFA